MKDDHGPSLPSLYHVRRARLELTGRTSIPICAWRDANWNLLRQAAAEEEEEEEEDRPCQTEVCRTALDMEADHGGRLINRYRH